MRVNDSGRDSIVRRPRTLAEAVSRYDLVLAVIPLAFAAGTLIGASPAIPDPLGVGGGGVVALAATAYALFGDPPIDRGGPGSGGRGRGASSDGKLPNAD